MRGRWPDLLPSTSDMQVVVLMGGLGTRLGESGKLVPKALMDVNGHPILIMNYGC